MYQKVTGDLRTAYDRAADERDRKEEPPWKMAERLAFLQLLQKESKQRLLEIGAGPGWDSLYFQENGLEVVCTDLSAEMIRLCREKGLDAHEMDFLTLDFADSSFDAVYARNCLLHVPKANLGEVLQEIRRVMAPGGLFFLGVFGGIDRDGPWEDDQHVPKRHFALYLDEEIAEIAAGYFDLRDFITIESGSKRSGVHFQRLILQKRTA